MRKGTVRRKVARRAKTRRGGAVGNNNDPSYNVSSRMYGGPAPNVSSRMYGGPAPIVNEPSVSSRMYGGPAPIVNAVPNRNVEAPNVNPAPNQNAPIVQAYYNNRHNANVLPIPAEPVFEIPFDMQNEMERFEKMGGYYFSGLVRGATAPIIESTRNFITSLGDEQVVTINYIWLFDHFPPGLASNHKVPSPGYLYIITRTHVYMTSLKYVYPFFNPLVFKTIYQFAEPLSAQLCAIFISYCKKDINLLNHPTASISAPKNVIRYFEAEGKNITGKMDSTKELELHRSKLEAIMNAIPSI